MSTRQRLENGLFLLGYLVRDIAKQQRMEWQHLFALKASTQPDDAPSTPKSSQHFGERQTMEKTNNLFPVFDSNDGALYASSNPMATSLFYGLHGNALLRAWQQPSTVHLSIVRRRIWGLGCC